MSYRNDTVYFLAHTHHVVEIVAFDFKSDLMTNEEVEAMYPPLKVAHVFSAPEDADSDSPEWRQAYADAEAKGFVVVRR